MLKINSTPEIHLSSSSSHDNVVPNADLASASILPPYIAQDQTQLPLFVLVPPYPHMASGDKITLNVGGAVTDPYQVTNADVGNQIVILLPPASVPPEDVKAGQKVTISYTIDNNENYAGKNNSEYSYIGVTGQAVRDITEIGLYPDIYLNKPKTYYLGNNYSVLASKDPISSDSIINDVYFFLTIGDNEYLYYDHFSNHSHNAFIVFLVNSMEMFRHFGKKLTVWANAISGDGDTVTLHSSPASTTNVPCLLQASAPTLSYLFPDTNNSQYVQGGALFGSIDMTIRHNDAIEPGDIITVTIASGGTDNSAKMNVSDNIFHTDIVVPFMSIENCKNNFTKNSIVYYKIDGINIGIFSDAVVINAIQ